MRKSLLILSGLAVGGTLAAVALAQGGKNPIVVFETSLGTIEVELYADKAPISTKNLLDYAAKGHYDSTVFHRVIPGFMIQGGGYTADMKEKPVAAPIKNEAANGLANKRGTLAMARTMVVDSATSQFFINVVDNARLDYRGPDNVGYAVFGQVVKGMEVADKIVALPTCPKSGPSVCKQTLPLGMQDVPAELPVIKKAYKKP